MKFSSVFFFSSLACAAPKLVSRQQTVVSTITDTVNTLEDSTSKNYDAITAAVASIEDNVSAEVEATIRANFQAILEAFEDAAEVIVDVTTDGAGNIVESVKNLSRQQIKELADAIKAAQRIINGLEATIRVTVTDLGPAAQAAIKDEVDAVKAAIAPFVKPLTAFADAASKANAGVGVTINGLRNALKEIDGVLKSIAASLGIPELGNILNLGNLLGGKLLSGK